MHLEAILEEWIAYRRALREKDREIFDEVVGKARMHASAASYCAHLDPVETALLSILLEMQREIRALRRDSPSAGEVGDPKGHDEGLPP